jgi:hypothetical protein
MSFLKRIFGRTTTDPTAEWGPFTGVIPDFDLTEMSFGSLRFGDGFQSASFLGRPGNVEHIPSDYTILFYPSGGLELHFRSEKLVRLVFYIAPDEFTNELIMEFSRPAVRGGVPHGTRLTPELDQQKITALFGAPDSVEAGSPETILYYTRNGVELEFELHDKGRLTTWNVAREEGGS